MHCKVHTSIGEIPATAWNGLFDSDNPFVRHEFLLALEESGCVTAEQGWQPRHILLIDGGQTLAALPLYAKTHSYGEFVFDWGWAGAYSRYGLDYYPKLLTAIPFSPVAGPRIGLARQADAQAVVAALLEAVRQLATKEQYSGWHLLFPGQRLQRVLRDLDGQTSVLLREAVQFHWFNRDYRSFDDFLAGFRSARRKNLKRERRAVAEQGVSLQRIDGPQINDEEWLGFYRCYQSTYLKRSGHEGYLNLDFFERLRATMADRLMLVTARRAGELLACALFLHDKRRLYGRYWGALEDVSCLHFEACFYQGIEFCIERGLREFDPGTQGEHKLMRGFEPVKSASYHWIADTRFRTAIADFLKLEKRGTSEYQRQAAAYLPYKKDDS